MKVTINGCSTEEIAGIGNQGNVATRQLNMKIRIYKSTVGGTATYGDELWVINKIDPTEIQTVEMNYWCRCSQLVRTDGIRNLEIRKRVGINSGIFEAIAC